MNIEIMDDLQLLGESDKNRLCEVLVFAAKKEGINDEAELSINIVNDEQIQQLNHEYRGKNQPTDVLSFPFDDFKVIVGMPILLGDLIISFETVQKQAKQYNHSIERELCFLAVHGLLHLIGYTHDTEEEEKEMFDKQEKILQEYGLER